MSGTRRSGDRRGPPLPPRPPPRRGRGRGGPGGGGGGGGGGEARREHGPIALLDAYSAGSPEGWSEALDRAEASAPQVLLVAAGTDEWTSFCLRQADRVLAVADDGAPAGATALRGCDLVVDAKDAAEGG